MRVLVVAVLVVAAAGLPQPQQASGQAGASVQQTADLTQLSDAELLSALTGAAADIPPQPVVDPVPPQPVVDPVPQPQPQPQQPAGTLNEPQQPAAPLTQPQQPAGALNEPQLTDAELLAALGIGASQGELVRCSNAQYFCVPYYQCREDEIITDGAGLIDIRFGSAQNQTEPLSHSECPGYIDVCCRDPMAKPEIVDPPYEPRCGRRNAQGVNARIVGFREGQSQFGEFPWMAAVLRVEDVGGQEKNLFVCGGALIHPQVVLTAAHCVYQQQDSALRVRLGEWDTQHTTEFYPHVDADVARVTVHPQFNGRNLHNDVALLFLAAPVQLQEHIDTLCLPELGVSYDGADCVATGWGKDRFDSGQYQTVLKQVDLTRVNHAYCQSQLRTTRLGTRFLLDDSFTCAGAPPQPVPAAGEAAKAAAEGGQVADTCTGDGGSPLACRDPLNPDRYVHGGIVAWGIGCGEKGIPGVYADPQQFVFWIDQHISEYFQLPQSYFGLQQPAAAAQP